MIGWQYESPVDAWWFNTRQMSSEPFPGNMVLFVGAGISVDAPTLLPPGGLLTQALVEHLLSKDAAEEIIDVFQKCALVVGRNLPRLEHILEVACYQSSFSGNPRNLLRLFENRRPNQNHRLIAQHLIKHRGWVITTNFDDCIETAFLEATGTSLPVHVLNHATKTLSVLGGQSGEGWGIVKLHGTIAQGVEMLGATLSDLVPRLPPPFRQLLNQIFDTADLVVVAGYSGTDHFDINGWIRDRLNAKKKPHLIWLKHGDPSPHEDKQEPQLSWARACGGLRLLHGETSANLAGILQQVLLEKEPQDEEKSLSTQLDELYRPTDDQRYLNGVRICLAIGLSQRAEDELRKLYHRKKNEEMDLQLMAEVYACNGHLPKAQKIFAWLRRHKGSSVAFKRIQLFRRGGHLLRALIEILLIAVEYRKLSLPEKLVLKLELVESWLEFSEMAQFFKLFRSKPFRRLFERGMNLCWPSRQLLSTVGMELSLEGRIQTLGLRSQTLFADRDNLPSWTLFDDQFSPPELWLKSGPAIPGFYLLGQSTYREEDKLVDMIYTYITQVKILLMAITRRWPKGRESKDELAQNPYIVLIESYLGIASQIADALDESYLRVTIAKSWIKVDKALGGVQYWKSQRLYLG